MQTTTTTDVLPLDLETYNNAHIYRPINHCFFLLPEINIDINRRELIWRYTSSPLVMLGGEGCNEVWWCSMLYRRKQAC
jgi:hypothetical protein